jgi:hypothetical protein
MSRRCRPLLSLALCLLCGTASAGQELLDIPVRPGATIPVLEMTGDGEVRYVVVYLAGGSGQRKLHSIDLDPLFIDPESLLTAQRQMADQVGAMAAVDTATDHPELEMRDRLTPEHQQDIHTVIATMRARHPGAKIALMGSSNGAWSAALLGARLGKEVDAVILISGNADTWTLAAGLKQPVLGVHHRRDACLQFADAYPKAHFYPLIVVDDARFPKVWSFTERDCSLQSAHALYGRRPQVYAAIADWLLTGILRAKID